ncbi:hypothetical protein BGZ76_010887 [Entomortierella beljakovae]|nr:hypothetical protein BGZ76_010887 [Entomortierella beljakovae]
MAAIGNLKAVLHYSQSGVDLNAQNNMNGWTALHWAAHRGHEPIVRALLMRGARTDILNKKGEAPAELARKPEICALFGKESESGPANQEGDSDKPTFTPAYLANPELSKLWSVPEGSVEDPKINQEAFALLNPNFKAPTLESKPAPQPLNSISVNVATPGTDAATKEILVYGESVNDERLLGAIFANPEDTVDKLIHQIREEIDDVPEQISLSRYNGSKVVPVNSKQFSNKVGVIFRGHDDAVVITNKAKG